MVSGFISERRPTSNRKAVRLHLGMRVRLESESAHTDRRGGACGGEPAPGQHRHRYPPRRLHPARYRPATRISAALQTRASLAPQGPVGRFLRVLQSGDHRVHRRPRSHRLIQRHGEKHAAARDRRRRGGRVADRVPRGPVLAGGHRRRAAPRTALRRPRKGACVAGGRLVPRPAPCGAHRRHPETDPVPPPAGGQGQPAGVSLPPSRPPTSSPCRC